MINCICHQATVHHKRCLARHRWAHWKSKVPKADEQRVQLDFVLSRGAKWRQAINHHSSDTAGSMIGGENANTGWNPCVQNWSGEDTQNRDNQT